jgi:FkbM family methyltransferase
VKRFGSKVYLVDPSPTGIKTMALPENQSEDVFFFPIGLAGESGTLEFGEPSNPEEGSFTIADQNTKRVQFQCTSVGDFMKKNGHTHLDLLKMDVEGCEYAVLDSIFREHLRIRMICCEFHHFLPGYSRLLTLRYILRLRREGYSLIYKDHHDYTFYAPGKLAIT